MTFKFGANNLNFIRVRLGQVRLGYDMLIFMLFAPQMTNEHHICNQHLK